LAPLLGAAAAFATTLALAPPCGLFAAACALLLLARPRSASLLPFLLAGELAAVAPAGARPAAPTPFPFAGLVRVAAPTQPTTGGRHMTRVELEEAIDRARARASGVLLLEGGAAPLWPRGELLEARGLLEPGTAPRNPGAPGSRIERARLRAEHVAPASDEAIGGAASWRRLRRALDRLGNAIADRLRQRLSPRVAALTNALVLGRAEELDPEFRAGLRGIGAWHFLAVSGSHVALVALLLEALLSRLRLPALPRAATILLFLFFYAWLSGGEAPALRAAIGGVGAGLVAGGRRLPSGPTWLAAAFLLLVAGEPARARDAGLQLSFVAVVSLAAAARYGAARSPKGTGAGIDFRAPLLRAARFAIAASIATAPLTAFHFGNVTPIAPIATLLLGPVVAVALGVGLVAAASTALPPACTALFAPPLWLSERVLSLAAAGGDRLPGTPLEVVVPSTIAVTLLAGAWFALLARRPAVAALLTAATLPLVAAARSAEPSFTLLAVGHGQSALLRDGDRAELFDAGSDGTLLPDELLRALRGLGVDRLDALALSHLDADHAALAPAVVRALDVAALHLSPPARRELAGSDAPLAKELRAAVAERGVPIVATAAGDRIGAHECLWPPRGRDFAARNDGSLVVKLRAGGRTILLAGDLEGFPLLELASRLTEPVDLLVLPHHGNADPGLAGLLRRVRPELALASREERPPPPETRAALGGLGIPWLSTGSGGAISCDFPPGREAPCFRARRAR
jgi:competence protein ComEC